MTQNVVIVSPASLLALLRTAALYWKQVKFAEEASVVIATVQEFYKRMATWSSHFAKVGRHLESATKTYNQSVGSWDGSVLPQARKLEDLRVSQNLPKQIEDLREIETMARDPIELE
jgi:DNA recombination protein RmuC